MDLDTMYKYSIAKKNKSATDILVIELYELKEELRTKSTIKKEEK